MDKFIFFKAVVLTEWIIIFSGWLYGITKKELSLIYKINNPWKCRNYGILAFLAAFSGLLPFGKISTKLPFEIILFFFIISFTGPVFYYWARLTLKKHWSSEARILENHQLVINGPYKLVRHPIYLSKIILGFSTAVIFQSWIVLIFSVLLILSGIYQAKTEEKLLKKYFGKKFDEYAKKTPMIFPSKEHERNKI